ncbi:hypothetical protein ACFWPX_03360 [Nocardia sp. NPDC058518]|uniref:hypothetical protein n=1 Tax=Nocardia sp. NPDC058518 TaxID=3346534 RepID=UPI00365D683D
MPNGDLLPGHGAGWLDPVDSDDGHSEQGPPTQLNPAASRTIAPGNRTRKHSRTVLFGTGVVGTLTGVVVGTAVPLMLDTAAPTTTIASLAPTAPSTTAAPPVMACVGVRSRTVTDGPGDTTTVAGVIAKFEHAYYTQRNVEAALALVDPQAGVTGEGLTAAIAALPAGATHCVGIDVIAANTAEVHLVELHVDGRRLDYLQLINVAASAPGLVITNIQKRGS